MSPLSRISRRLSRAVSQLSFSAPVTHVYNPLAYARVPHERYLEQYGTAPKPVLLLGMNPGPFGMVQTGIPFGDVTLVRDWLGIQAAVGRPPREHERRPVLGFACERSEVSGTRLWGFARSHWGEPTHFFRQFFVVNYCPLAFLEASGKNRTPDRLLAQEKSDLFAACDEALRAVVRELCPELIIGIGTFAERRARRVVEGDRVRVGRVLHPSPASPAANRGWAASARLQLEALGVTVPSPPFD